MNPASASMVRRNYLLPADKKDIFFDWIQEMLNHSFVLDLPGTYADTFAFVEKLISEHMAKPEGSRLSKVLPSIGTFHTALPLRVSFEDYDKKYCITKRRFIRPSFNEIRHIVNLAQVREIGKNLRFIAFDGDQTLYSDGGNFEVSGGSGELASALKELLLNDVYVAVVTAAGYGLDGSKYEIRLGALLQYLQRSGLTNAQLNRFLVCGGECNYLLRCALVDEGNGVCNAHLVPVYPEEWQAAHLSGPKPSQWSTTDINAILDVAESTMKEAIQEMALRVKFVRKERAIGMFPGGKAMCASVPVGHGSNKVKRESLDEVVFRIKEALIAHHATAAATLPYCVFNGGRDVWVDIGNKSIGVAALQAFLGVTPATCLYVGDQFLNTGNDIAARNVSPCIWISNPAETGKILQHVLKHTGINVLAQSTSHVSLSSLAGSQSTPASGAAGSAASSGATETKTVFDVYTGAMK